jgi:OFA family oxalate/formate antiporter-like MFS transporter
LITPRRARAAADSLLWLAGGRRYWPFAAAPLLFLCLGCFVVRDQFMTAAGLEDPGAWSPGILFIGLGAALGGLLAEYFDEADVAYAGVALFGLGFITLGFTSIPEPRFIAVELLIGVGSGLAYAAGIPLVLRWFPDRIGIAIGGAVAGYVPAGTLGSRAVNFLIERTGWQTAAVVTGLALAIVAGSAVKLLRGPRAEPMSASVSGDGTQVGPVAMLRSSSFRALYLSYALATTGAMMVYTLLPRLTLDPASRNRTHALVALHLMGQLGALANFSARPIAGWMSDRVGGATTLRFAIVLILGGAIGAAVVQSPEATWGISFFVLAGYGALLAIYPILTTQTYGLQHAGANYGIVFTAWAVGSLIGRWLALLLVRASGTVGTAFLGAALVAAVGLSVAPTRVRLARAPAPSSN